MVVDEDEDPLDANETPRRQAGTKPQGKPRRLVNPKRTAKGFAPVVPRKTPRQKMPDPPPYSSVPPGNPPSRRGPGRPSKISHQGLKANVNLLEKLGNHMLMHLQNSSEAALEPVDYLENQALRFWKTRRFQPINTPTIKILMKS